MVAGEENSVSTINYVNEAEHYSNEDSLNARVVHRLWLQTIIFPIPRSFGTHESSYYQI